MSGIPVSPLSSEFCTVQLPERLINLSLQKSEASSFQGLFYILLLTPELQMSHKGKIYSRTDIISDRRLQRSKHGSNCARSSEQQDMLALG